MNTSRYLPHAPVVDRAADRRATVDLTMADAVVTVDGAVLARDGRVVLVPGSSQPTASVQAFLGHHGGRDLALVVPAEGADAAEGLTGADGVAAGGTLVPLRALLAALPADEVGHRDRELASTAVALAAWHAHHGRCAHCGEATTVAAGGWARRCVAEGRDHYPRTDPAIIVAVTDPEDRLLLAHAAHWSEGRYSHLAGYVEPGESFEQAVHREVGEEVGVQVTDVTYVASQPWPFPASVMVGFRARAAATELTPDGVEITDARWVSRAQFAAMVDAGDLIPPPLGSIARSLLEDWWGGDISHEVADDVRDT